MARSLNAQCCIVGGGPAGMMLGYLMGRAGVRTIVLEKHADFLRDFRGDTVHPSTLEIMRELGLLTEFLTRPHSEVSTVAVQIGEDTFNIADFRHISGACRFIAFMPQWDFLSFLAEKSQRFASLTVLMQAEVTALAQTSGRVTGVTATSPDGPIDVRADLVIGCDGRSSTVRTAAGLVVKDLGSPIDVLWFRLSKKPNDPVDVLGRLGRGTMIVTIDRNDYWQCAFVIAKGGIEHVRAQGLAEFKNAVATGAQFLSDRVDEISSFDDVKLLSVSVDRLVSWSKPGLLCIGDAAHAMSPVGGVGVNLAIQDAVATANLLAGKLKSGRLQDDDLDRIRRRRLFPVKVIQGVQVAVQDRVLRPTIAGLYSDLKAPWPVRLLDAAPWARRWPAQIIGYGVRPEHVRSPEI